MVSEASIEVSLRYSPLPWEVSRLSSDLSDLKMEKLAFIRSYVETKPVPEIDSLDVNEKLEMLLSVARAGRMRMAAASKTAAARMQISLRSWPPCGPSHGR